MVHDWIAGRLAEGAAKPKRRPLPALRAARAVDLDAAHSPEAARSTTGLLWSQVDLERRVAWIHADQAKARRAIPVPLNAEAIRTIQKQHSKHPTHVFTFRGRTITQVSTTSWYAALQRAGIEDFRWHDLRHTWASWHVQNGTPLFALQEMGGWESAEMVRP